METKNNGTILLYKFKKSNNFWNNITGKLIVFFTNSNFVHTAIYLNNKTYEETIWKENNKWKSGVKVTEGLKYADTYLQPIKSLSRCEVFAMIKIIENFYETKRYNFLKLISLSLVYPFKWFFKKINWIPFNSYLFGEICSVMPDELYKDMGIDLFPGEREGYTVPGMYIDSKLLK